MKFVVIKSIYEKGYRKYYFLNNIWIHANTNFKILILRGQSKMA